MDENKNNEQMAAAPTWCDSAQRAAVQKALTAARKCRVPLMLELLSQLAMAMGGANWLGPKVNAITFDSLAECLAAARSAKGCGIYAWGGIVAPAAEAA
jgi:hypothetical protein